MQSRCMHSSRHSACAACDATAELRRSCTQLKPSARTQAVRAGRLRVPPALRAVVAAVESQEHASGWAPGLLPYDLLRTDALHASVAAVSLRKKE